MHCMTAVLVAVTARKLAEVNVSEVDQGRGNQVCDLSTDRKGRLTTLLAMPRESMSSLFQVLPDRVQEIHGTTKETRRRSKAQIRRPFN